MAKDFDKENIAPIDNHPTQSDECVVETDFETDASNDHESHLDSEDVIIVRKNIAFGLLSGATKYILDNIWYLVLPWIVILILGLLLFSC